MTYAQGEITFFRIADDADMDGAAFSDRDPEGRLIVGHSETGHHHVLDRPDVVAVERRKAPAGMRILRLLVAEPTQCLHLRGYDTHAPITLAPGKWEARIAREYDPYAKLSRRVAD